MLSDEGIASTIRLHLGDQVSVTPHDPSGNSPMNVVLEAAEEALGRKVAVLWLEGTPPEYFSLPGLDPAIIAFSARYLELVGSMRGMLYNDVVDEQLLDDVAFRTHLRVTAELVLHQGRPALACWLLARSLEGETLNFRGVTMADLEHMPKNELYMAVWFYALTHEIGHAFAHDQGSHSPGPDVVQRISDTIDAVIDALEYRPYLDVFLERQQRMPASLQVEHLLMELDCDLFAFQVLHRATVDVMRENGTLGEFSIILLAQEFIGVFEAINYLNNYAVIARLTAVEGDPYRSDVFIKVAHLVRLNILTEFMAYYVVGSGGPDVERLHSLLVDMVNEKAPRLQHFDRGDRRAGEQILHPQLRDEDVAKYLARQFAAGGGLVAHHQSIIRDFCRQAQALGLRHRDLDLLAGLAETPEQAVSVCAEHVRPWFVPWAQTAEEGHPVALRLHDRGLVLAFHDRSAADLFCESLDPWRLPGTPRIGVITLPMALEEELQSWIRARLPPSTLTNLVVLCEGTSDFGTALESWSYESAPPSG